MWTSDDDQTSTADPPAKVDRPMPLVQLVTYAIGPHSIDEFVEYLEGDYAAELQRRGAIMSAVFMGIGTPGTVIAMRGVESGEAAGGLLEEFDEAAAFEAWQERGNAPPPPAEMLLLAPTRGSRFDGRRSEHARAAGIIDLRNYATRDGAGDAYQHHFESLIIPAVERYGGWVPGQFRHVKDPDRLLWMWAFTDERAREESRDAFYSGPEWRGLREPTLALVADHEDVRLVRPSWGSPFKG